MVQERKSTDQLLNQWKVAVLAIHFVAYVFRKGGLTKMGVGDRGVVSIDPCRTRERMVRIYIKSTKSRKKKKGTITGKSSPAK